MNQKLIIILVASLPKRISAWVDRGGFAVGMYAHVPLLLSGRGLRVNRLKVYDDECKKTTCSQRRCYCCCIVCYYCAATFDTFALEIPSIHLVFGFSKVGQYASLLSLSRFNAPRCYSPSVFLVNCLKHWGGGCHHLVSAPEPMYSAICVLNTFNAESRCGPGTFDSWGFPFLLLPFFRAKQTFGSTKNKCLPICGQAYTATQKDLHRVPGFADLCVFFCF